jgi:excisionase family DNA binding protein
MKPTRLQFDVRENTASSRQHAPRLERPSLPSGDSLTDRPLTAATVRGEGSNDDAAARVIATNKLMHAFEPLVGCGEAAKLLGNIHVKTLQRYARRGDIPGYQIGGHWYFRASELDSWLRSRINSSCHPCRSNQEAK